MRSQNAEQSRRREGPHSAGSAVSPPGRIGEALIQVHPFKKVGKLPKGLKPNAKTGVISRTPKKLTGTFSFTIRVTDSKKPKPKRTTTRTFSIIDH